MGPLYSKQYPKVNSKNLVSYQDLVDELMPADPSPAAVKSVK